MTDAFYLAVLDRDYDPNEPRFAVVEVSADARGLAQAGILAQPTSANLLLDPSTVQLSREARQRCQAVLAKLDESPSRQIPASVAQELVRILGVRCVDPQLVNRGGQVRLQAFCLTVGEMLTTFPLPRV